MMVFFNIKKKIVFTTYIDVAMHSPPRPEGASRTTGGTIRGNATGNSFRFADHTPGVKADSVIGFQKVAVRLYTTTPDPSISHAGGAAGLTFVKAKVPMNVYLHAVLQSLVKLDSSIERMLVFKLFMTVSYII